MNPNINGEPWMHWLAGVAAFPLWFGILMVVDWVTEPGSPISTFAFNGG